MHGFPAELNPNAKEGIQINRILWAYLGWWRAKQSLEPGSCAGAGTGINKRTAQSLVQASCMQLLQIWRHNWHATLMS